MDHDLRQLRARCLVAMQRGYPIANLSRQIRRLSKGVVVESNATAEELLATIDRALGLRPPLDSPAPLPPPVEDSASPVRDEQATESKPKAPDAKPSKKGAVRKDKPKRSKGKARKAAKKPAWNASMSKARLVEVAAAHGVEKPESFTRRELIEKLKAGRDAN
jgi:hypothetical protein